MSKINHFPDVISEWDCQVVTKKRIKRVALIKEFNSCHKCPYGSGGESLGSPMYCTFFEPPKQIMNSNGHPVTEMDDNRFIAKFCELPDDEIFNGIL
jgi:hypothetical protein